MNHPFTIGDRYRNRIGQYEVLSIDDPQMNIRYTDGHEQTVNVATQARIWQAIQDESKPPPKPDPTDDESLDTAPVRDLVSEVLHAHFFHPYPGDIIDQVCLAIEGNDAWLRRYRSLVEHFSSRGKNGQLTVNSNIGWYTKELTGMITLEFPMKAQSTLIQSYSRLGYQ